jgi:hypothetical protein
VGDVGQLHEDAPIPALYDHCRRIYNAMFAEARSVKVLAEPTEPDGIDQPEGSIMVYEGFLTALVTQQCNLSTPYYTKAVNKLKAMGCIRQLKRGGGSAPSQWELTYEPTVEAFMRATDPKQPPQSKDAMHNQQVLALSRRVGDLEKTVGALVQAFATLQGKEPQEENQT